MHPVVYYLISLIIIGAIGMAIANRKADAVTRKQRWLKFFTYILITGIVILSIFYKFFQTVSIIIVIVAFLELYYVNSSALSRSLWRIIFSFIVLALVATLFILFGKEFNAQFILFIYLQVLVFDAFCQIAGQIFGRHQLVPNISPSKTVEGLVGGFLVCVFCAVLTSSWINTNKSMGLLYGCLTAISSFTGDILASMYKRQVQVKDYSRLLPGQGGFLDRFDSFLMTGAVYYTIFHWLMNNRFATGG